MPLEAEDMKKGIKIEDLWVDIGAKDKQDAEKIISIGDQIVIAQGFEELRDSLAVSRGFDNKCGAFAVLEAARMLSGMGLGAEVYAVATVQEEIGLRGARTSAFGIDPKVGIVTDVTRATDSPALKGEEKRFGDIKTGRGPAVAREANINPKIHELIINAAKDHGIPYQIEGSPRGTDTDANVIQFTRSGVATGPISIPDRHIHSPCEIINLEDLENAYKLIAFTVERIDDEMDFVPF